MLENRGIGLGNHGENTFCVQENVEKRGILGGMGVRGLVGGQMSEGSGQLKRGDLRAYLGSVEGLYPLDGLGRFTGISEGFTGKELEPCSCGKGLLPQGGPVSKKFAPKFFGGKIESPAFPNARLSRESI